MSTSDFDTIAPAGRLSLLPLRRGVVFPGTVITLPIGRSRSRALVESLTAGKSIIGIAVQRDARVKNPGVADLHPVGTLAKVVRIRQNSDRMYTLTLEGLFRFEMKNVVQSDPYWVGEGAGLVEVIDDPDETRILAEILREELIGLDPEGAGGLARIAGAAQVDSDPGAFADRIAASLELTPEQQVQVLLTLDVAERLRLVTQLIGRSLSTSELRKKLESEVRKNMSKDQREAVLRQQLRAIQKELGEGAGEENDELEQKLTGMEFPEEVKKVVDRELRRLRGLNRAHAEYGVIRNYLEWIADLPWDKAADVNDDVDAIAEKLDADHYGLEEVKKRILEHMAVLKIAGNKKGTILCLSGPPGVGKTSIGRSIAEATGRPFVRISLGGVRDEAEIRGHRRTYVGSLPGRIIHSLKKAGARNPVMLLDEIDKLKEGWAGSPEAALLEVLDPEQNKFFQDHYMEVPFDLSEVLFICTANTLDTLSPPLRDRLEIVEISGYGREEKAHIARRHLIPRQLEQHGLESITVEVTDDALDVIVREYTREAGVRQLERVFGKICRALTLDVARRKDKEPELTFKVDVADLEHYLGKPKFVREVAERTSIPGVATGLAWTPVGGDILFIETSRMPGKGHLEITGSLGDVMKESARAALTFVRSNADRLGVDPEFLESQDLHIHVPAGGVPKDGPSAGVTMFTALTSLLTGRCVRPDTAMTGECSLRGRVLPVGGIKAKVLAAHRAGLTRVILPKRNERDLSEVPEEVRDAMEFILAEDMHQVLAAALEDAPSGGKLTVDAGAEDLEDVGPGVQA